MTWAAAILLPAFALAAGYWLGRFGDRRPEARFDAMRAEIRASDDRMNALLADLRQAMMTWRHPERVGGAECYFGTRVPVATVMRWLQDGATDERIHGAHPGLPPGAVEYARQRLQGTPEQVRVWLADFDPEGDDDHPEA